MLSRCIIDDSRSTIYNSRVLLQLVVSFTIVIYDCYILIVQATALEDLKTVNYDCTKIS
jgi:hypothetical protein